MKRRAFVIGGVCAGAAVLAPQRASAQLLPRQYQQMLTIAVNTPLSGDRGAAGREIVAGVQAAIDYANRYGGSYGSAFALRTFDDMDALAESMVNVQFAASDPSVIATIGGFDGPLITASLTTYENSQMPLLVAGSTADGITAHGYRNVWRLPTKDSLEGQFAAQYAAKHAKPKLAIAVCQDGDYGASVAQGFLTQSKPSGMNALVYLFGNDKPNYAGAAKELLAKNPDFLYLCGLTSAMGPLIPALRTAGYSAPIAASQGFFNERTLQDYAQDFKGGFVSTSMPPLDLAPDVAPALSEFRARAPITSLSAFAYAAAQIVMAAVRRTGSSNRLSTIAALQAPSLYNTLVGSFQFTPLGDPIDPIVYFYTVADGKFKYAAPSHPTAFVL